jgi:hypothetical protein
MALSCGNGMSAHTCTCSTVRYVLGSLWEDGVFMFHHGLGLPEFASSLHTSSIPFRLSTHIMLAIILA